VKEIVYQAGPYVGIAGRSWLDGSDLTVSGSLMLLSLILILSSCTRENTIAAGKDVIESEYSVETGEVYNHLTTSNVIRDIVNHPAFIGFGESLLPRDNNSGYYNTQLSNVASLMPYHNHVEPDIVVGAINHMIDETNDEKTIFYDFYTNEQKQQDPSTGKTGLFFYRGKLDAPFAIVCPGGGFSYVGSLHEGFPLAWRISELGLNAFVWTLAI
jgi:ABC-type oligopeptide transport system substrate-binding subunit